MVTVTPDDDVVNNNVSIVMAIVGSLVLVLITLLCVFVFCIVITKTVSKKKRKEECSIAVNDI